MNKHWNVLSIGLHILNLISTLGKMVVKVDSVWYVKSVVNVIIILGLSS